MSLKEALIGTDYKIKLIESDDSELNSFLFSLGCYSGQFITIVSRLKDSLVVAIKDARYTIDNQLASAIIV